ncbi:MAG: FtsX-like permease family protein [Acidobacteriota bacterium]
MPFIFRMAFRETRAAWKRLAFFFLCLSIGVGSIVTLRSVIQTVRHTLTRESRALLGGDLSLSTNRPWDPKVRDTIDSTLASIPYTARADELETMSMVRPEDPEKQVARLVELVGVQQAYPLYGTVTLEGGYPYAHGLLRDHGALLRRDLLVQLDVGIGEAIVIGDRRFTVRGVITAEPGRSTGGFSFGSRVFVDFADLQETGLITYGSRASYRVRLKVADGAADRLASSLRGPLRSQFVSVRSFRSTENRLSDNLVRAENYLSLVGLVIVVLGGVGVWSVVRVFVHQKIKAVAVLKCVGATARQILGIYVLQVLGMGLAGSLAGVGFAGAALWWLRPVIDTTAGIATPYALTGAAIAQGAGIGLLISLLFALVPLLDVRHVRPSLLLRAAERPPHGPDWVKRAAIVSVGAGLVALASWQAASLRIGLVLSVGFAAIALILHGAGLLLVKVMAPLQASRRFEVRYAARRVVRPGNQTRAILLTVGLGAFLVVGVRVLQANLLNEFQLDLRPNTPDMFVIDIQPDQEAGVRALLSDSANGVRTQANLIPVLRARVSRVQGARVQLESYEDVRRRGGLGREYVITYRPGLEANETVVEGHFWDASPAERPEISIEEGLRDRAGLSLGDVVTFDILGRSVEATVTSVRRVDWADARAGGFMFVFRPGPLDSAPRMFIAPIKGPADPVARARLQRALTERFPNVSVVDVQEILASVSKVVSDVTFAVTVVGALVLFSGILILVGSISMTKFQRVYEAAVLKTLGATTRTVALLLVFEYALLGFIAGGIGSLGALGLSWGVSRYAFDVPWTPLPGYVAAGLAASIALVTVVGLAASLDVLRRKPLATLRAE